MQQSHEVEMQNLSSKIHLQTW